MLQYVIREPKQKTDNPPLLVLLHGYGSNEMDLFSFAEELPEEFVIVSARAPYEMGYGGYAWFAINFEATDRNRSNLKEAKASLSKIDTFITEIKEKYDTNPDKTFLLGFSQGAILSYAYSLTYPNKVQHIIALSGYLNEELLPDTLPKHVETDYYISHGTVDQVLPIDWARKAPDFLSKLHLQNEYTEYPVGHGVAPQNFYSFKEWIEKRL